MNRPRIQIARHQITAHFEASKQNVFTGSQLASLLDELRDRLRLAKSMTVISFIEFLVAEGILREDKLRFLSRSVIRYVHGDASVYELAMSLRPDAYLSHLSALYLHKLTEQQPNVIYINEEQDTRSNPNTVLEQVRIDDAFKRPARLSNNRAKWRDYTLYVLNGMNTGSTGVVNRLSETGVPVRVTNIERTLIDSVVRPMYSGDVPGVVDAFKRASGTVSVQQIASMLGMIGYTYPYHQAIGFYLQHSGAYRPELVHVFRKMERRYDFYLTHQMENPKYSKIWRVYYPNYL